MTVKPDKPTCVGTTKAGAPCRSVILVADGFCARHTPDPSLRTKTRNRQRVLHAQTRDPTGYDAWFAEDFYLLERPIQEWADRIGVSYQNAAKHFAWQRRQNTLEEMAKTAKPPRPDGLPESHFDLLEKHIPLLVDGFLEFRARFFRDERGDPYMTPDFQLRWVESIFKVVATGGRQMILSPPRFGKTALLTHVCLFLLCLYPAFRILWVGAAQRIAEKAVSNASMIFANSKELAEVYAPVTGFVPAARDGLSWSKGEFTVATRLQSEDGYQVSGPSMLALGRGGTILSLNADLLVVDDIEDQSSTSQPGTRENTRDWFLSQLGSRKMAHTGLFMIGSRQHPADLYGRILDDGGDDWSIFVEQAHDPLCDIPETDYEKHWDCLLFPELRDMKWLAGQQRGAEAVGNPGLYQMVYQNRVDVDGLAVFRAEEVNGCKDKRYRLGVVPSHENGLLANDSRGVALVAGLDPAMVGYQASVLLAYQTQPELKIWVVDVDNNEGGGIPAMERMMRRWWDKYRVDRWVVESNLLGAVSSYAEIRTFAADHQILIEDFRTHAGNKGSHMFGVSAMSPLFTNKNIVLPYGDEQSVSLMDLYAKQFVLWDASSSNRNSAARSRASVKTDLVMATWMPWNSVIRREMQDYNSEVKFLQDDSGYEISQWDVGDFETAEMVPW